MADDEERTSSDSEAEAIEAAIEDSDEDVRYNLRPRVTTREQERSHPASPLFQTMIEARLSGQSADMIANLRQTLAVFFERLLSTPRMSVASALDGRQHRRFEDDLRSGTEAH